MTKTPTQNRVTSGRKRSARDYYETPYGLCYSYLKDFVHYDRPLPTILDAGAGNGVWGKAARKLFPKAYILGVDLTDQPILGQDEKSDYNEWVQEDYLNMEAGIFTPDIIIGNPPYSLAEPFIRKSLELLSNKGELHFLLPVAFLGSKTRMRGLFKEYPHDYMTVSAKRPSFFSVNDKKTGKLRKHSTDAIEYAVFQWYRWEKDVDHVEYPFIRWFDWSYD